MGSPLLTLAHDVCDDPGVNLQRPMSLFGAYDEGDTTDRRLVRALTKTCQYLAGRYEWQAIKREFTFSTAAAEIQPVGLPTDFLRPVQNTMWVAGLRVEGPVNDEDWAAIRAGRLPQVMPAFRIYGDQMHLWPQPSVGQSVTYQYVSTAIGTSASNAPVIRFSADTDKALWDDELMTLGMVYQIRKSLRKDYAQDEKDLEMCILDRIKADGGSRILSMAGNRRSGLQRPAVSLVSQTPSWNGSDW
jgi:hypothetical protein